MTKQESQKLDLEISKLRIEIDKTIQDVRHAPIKLYMAFGAIIGAVFARLF